MNIFEEGDNIRLQLMEMNSSRMLFDFTVSKEAFNELKEHMIKHLKEFKLDSGEKSEEGIKGLSYLILPSEDSKPEPKKGGSGSNIGEYYMDRDLYGGL